ncbi:uncharacterized protein LOC134684638 [Mytilus trossulus]|uniref:uncharacterized protein LOC134684638 n=1 Tax=Mytilus trossulus TaxID=6551 RepID=UPI00300727B6
MYSLSVIGLILCLVYTSFLMQETEADCVACATSFGSGITGAGQDKEKTCSLVNTYLTCLDDECKADGSKATIDAAKKAVADYGCGACSIIVNLTVIGLGLSLYMLV